MKAQANWYSDQYGIEVPPKSYDHVPNVTHWSFKVPLNQLQKICDPSDMVQFLGCTFSNTGFVKLNDLEADKYVPKFIKKNIKEEIKTNPDLCVTFIPEPNKEISSEMSLAIFYHERAHCNNIFHDPATSHGWFKLEGNKLVPVSE